MRKKKELTLLLGVLMVDSTGKLYDPCIIQQGVGLKHNQDAMRECNIDLCVIPGGCTMYLQPLDISVITMVVPLDNDNKRTYNNIK